jgi:hypothetical protein
MSAFDGFATFDADPTASITAEFNRLAIHNGWKKTSINYTNQRARYAAVEFEVQFGSNLSALEGWQALCKTVGIAPEDIPSSVTQCKKVRSKTLHYPHPFFLL